MRWRAHRLRLQRLWRQGAKQREDDRQLVVTNYGYDKLSHLTSTTLVQGLTALHGRCESRSRRAFQRIHESNRVLAPMGSAQVATIFIVCRTL